jgi:cobaltochelatase CobN
MGRLLLLSTADTDLLTAAAADAGWGVGNPARIPADDVPGLLADVDLIVVRLLGGRDTWPAGLDAVVASGLPVVVLGGEASPDALLQAHSTVPAGVVTQALRYLVEGGVDNLRQLAAFLSDTILLTGIGFDPPAPMPAWGVHELPATSVAQTRDPMIDPVVGPTVGPVVGIVYYRAHELSGNVAFVDDLCAAVKHAGGRPLPVFTASLRGLTSDDSTGLLDQLRQCDVLITTVLAGGGLVPADAAAGGDEDAWDVGVLGDLDMPVLQGMALTTSRQAWLDSDAALTPLDATTHVMMPEFDGRIIGVPFSFKETNRAGLPVYVADSERCARLAGIATRLGRLRHIPVADRRLAVMLTAYPTKHARVGNAVGLDTPASAVELFRALIRAGYDLGGLDVDEIGRGSGPDGTDQLPGDALIHALIAAGGHDVEYLTYEQLATSMARIPASVYRRWFDALPTDFPTSVVREWGEPPGRLYLDDSGPEPAIAVAGLRFGNVVLMIQPPRGFSDNPVAIYHDPQLPPPHHYLAAYRWLERPTSDGGFGADAIVHLGKHGTLEWLPGKGLGMSADTAPDAVLGDLPVIYPFIVNDPGEGAQAKRRAHAVIIDHLVPPMARAETYGDLARLEQLLDEYAHVASVDPAKAPAVRQQIWTLVKAAELHHDLHTADMPGDDAFDDFVLHIDGYLCEIKDVQIRDGLHVLGAVPTGEARVNLVLAVLRATQIWGGQTQALPGLRAALASRHGLDEQALLANPGATLTGRQASAGAALAAEVAALTGPENGSHRTASDLVDLLERQARQLIEGMEAAGWDRSKVAAVVAGALGDVNGRPGDADVQAVLDFATAEVVPRLNRCTDEIDNTLRALNGRYVAAGPSGSPTRGLVNVLPTGRNFYTVDPKAIPSRNAWDVGVALAESLLAKHHASSGQWLHSVGLTVWGTAAMRTQGDDVAEILHLLGVRPQWDAASRRVTGFEIVPLSELRRPRVDVTVRISGFFRDAFPHVVALLDDVVRAVADLDESAEDNHLRSNVLADLDRHGDHRRATTRIFGSAPGAYGAGLLPLMDSKNWRTDADLAEVYAAWGGYAYGRHLDGAPARPDMERAFSRIQVAVKNQDTREHDIMDSDDYFQYHGGMVAMVRHLTGAAPAAYVGDSAIPEQVRTRTLDEEAARVFRARVVNPRWIAAMRRHGYKGAFEMAATVDYIFGYDATAGVVEDWMYETLTREYVQNSEVAEFMRASNPWARKGIAERLVEAAQRGLWAQPSTTALDALHQAILETESDLEDAEPDGVAGR